ncbi:hypothetical protein Bca52824_048144 [Brassica carinata]|uniref:Uncharacterized protein n=1 Tax=Brassica carinata TaxID=52824 RepID=A0A8X7UQM3_BRACI|nr:hypothetical protein Bca52824_048144 [Brassica carinata]
MVMPQSEFDHAEKEGALYGKVMVHESVEFLLVQNQCQLRLAGNSLLLHLLGFMGLADVQLLFSALIDFMYKNLQFFRTRME